LGGDADLFLDRQMRQKRINFRFCHFHRMADIVKENEPLEPMAIGLLGPPAVCNDVSGALLAIEPSTSAAAGDLRQWPMVVYLLMF
jgi:hypothetical protein